MARDRRPHLRIPARRDNRRARNPEPAIRPRQLPSGRYREHPAGVAAQRLPGRGAVGQPPHPHRAVVAAAGDDRGAIRQRRDRHREHQAGMAVQRPSDRGAVGQPPHPYRAVVAAAGDDRPAGGSVRAGPRAAGSGQRQARGRAGPSRSRRGDDRGDQRAGHGCPPLREAGPVSAVGRPQASAGASACSSGALKRVMYHHSGCPRGDLNPQAGDSSPEW